VNVKEINRGIDLKQSIIIVLYTIYSFLYAHNIDSKGNAFLLILSIIAVLGLLNARLSVEFLKSVIILFVVIFGLSLLTTISGHWPNGNNDWTFSSANKFILCSLVISIFTHCVATEKRILPIATVTCCLCLSIFMIIQNSGLDLKNLLTKFSIQTVDGNWNEKYHSFWLVFLTWTSIFLTSTCFRKKKANLINLLVLVYTTIALLTSYSNSAILAWIISLCIFLLSKFNAKLLWKSLSLFIAFYILTFPLIWQLFPASYWEWTNSVHDRTLIRFLLFETASNAILDNWIWGHGFGSSLSLSISPYLPELTTHNNRLEWLSHYGGLFPGGHPHNIVALIWLDWGIIGVFSILFFVYKSYFWLMPMMVIQQKGPFINSLIISALVIFSFSFSIWQTDVVMTYAMLIVSLMIITKTTCKSASTSKGYLE
jgi:O-antigen ligase